MSLYAAKTSVSVESSRAEIEKILTRYGADQFAYAADSMRGLASIQFRAHKRIIQFTLHLPKSTDDEFRRTEKRRSLRSQEKVIEAWEQACRQRWRALCLCIKAKLEAVECGITEFEDEFMAQIVMPGGETLGKIMKPQVEQAYITGKPALAVESLLPHYEEGDDGQI